MSVDPAETERIRTEYRRRDAVIPPDTYSLVKPVNLFFLQQRQRQALAFLRRAGALPLTGKKILEIGCGSRGWLADFEAWGALRQDLAGIDLDDTRARQLRRVLSGSQAEDGALLVRGADIRVGDAASLPWRSESFDIVLQSTVFTSVLDSEMKRRIAMEMLRVLAPNGLVLWYDFAFNNPSNPHVRGVPKAEIHSLFAGSSITLRRITLAPPLARRLVPLSWIGSLLLEELRLLNTHYLGVIRKTARSTNGRR